MGYYTRYKLEWKPQNSTVVRACDHELPKMPNGEQPKYCPTCGKPVTADAQEVVSRYIKEQQDADDEAFYAITPEGDTAESCKWYDHEEEMRSMSEEFPEILFTLHGEGEEAGDIWAKYFLNGKMQEARAKIVIEEFDESKLR